MFEWFNKRRKKMARRGKKQKIPMKPLEYPPKIILAWAKAVDGHEKIQEWLAENGYEELAVSVWALKLKQDARDWLMENGFPHLMAMINAAEGNEPALNWLKTHNFQLFYNMALAIDGEKEGFQWIQANATPDIFLLTQAIKKLKDSIEENHNDMHKFGAD